MVSFEQYLDCLISQLGNRQSKEGIDKIFNLFDVNKKNVINIMDLQRIAEELGEQMNV